MMCFYQQIGCFMGFSITGCVFSGAMFILYCINVQNLAGLDFSLLVFFIFSLVELFLALASSIYCCRAVCCNSAAVENTVSNYQLIMFKAILKSFVANIFCIHILHQIFLHTYRSFHDVARAQFF